jgi:hypothetical protein
VDAEPPPPPLEVVRLPPPPFPPPPTLVVVAAGVDAGGGPALPSKPHSCSREVVATGLRFFFFLLGRVGAVLRGGAAVGVGVAE